jgi:threonine dehydratase
MESSPTLDDIHQAGARIKPYVRRTPLLDAGELNGRLGCQVFLKPESFQITGSFKARGAFSKSLLLGPEERARGIITSSSGNHAQAMAYVGTVINAKVVIVIPRDAPKVKIERTRALGAEVILFQGDQASRWAYVAELGRKNGYSLVHAFDDPMVMAGQGTIALEVMEDLADLHTIVVPLGGGGLLSGIATAIKETAPQVRVVGVEPLLAPKFQVSRRLGRPTTVPAGNTIADGVKAEVPYPMAHAILERYVDEIVLVEEECIKEGLRLLAEEAKLFVEGAAAVGIGAALSGKIKVSPSDKVCFVLSGGNWDLHHFMAAVHG